MQILPQCVNGKALKHTWSYKNANAKLIGYVARYEDKAGYKAVIPYFKFNEGKFSSGFDEGKRHLFGLDILDLQLDDQTIYIVEGEKCAAALQSLDLCAVTSPGGAHSAGQADWTVLKQFSDVVILPDNDKAGEDYARDVYRILRELGIQPKLVRLDYRSPSEDIVDWIVGWQSNWDGYSPVNDPNGSLKEEFLNACQKFVVAPPADWDIADLADLAATPGDWGVPTPILSTIPDVAPMTKELVPELFRDFVFDTAHSMQVPADFIVVPLIISIASVIGTGCAVRPKQNDKWEEFPNLWGACIAPPSKVMKSPTMKEGLKFLERLQVKYAKQYVEEMKAYEFDALAQKKLLEDNQRQLAEAVKGRGNDKVVNPDDIQKLKGDYQDLTNSQPQPNRRIFKVNDSTIQSLTQLMSYNKRGILVFNDEIVGLLAGLDSRPEERAYYLESWNGKGTYTDYKITRGLTDAPNICISIVGGIQPDKLANYQNQAINGNNDGLIQRFQLAVWPDEPSSWSYVDIEPNREAEKRIYGVFETLAEMDFSHYGAQQDDFNDNPFFRFDLKAQPVFIAWLENLQNVKLASEDNPLMVEHLTKYRSLMPSLALILHCIELAEGKKQNAISEDNARLAVAWSEYLETHARRMYAGKMRPEQSAAESLAKKIQQKALPVKFTSKMVYDKNWHGLKNVKQVDAACEILIDHNWLKIEPVQPKPGKTGRPPAPNYVINPALL